MDAPWADFAKNQISFITFNYDRSLELVLEHALMHRYGKAADEARAMVANFPIVHVYGKLRSLDPGAKDFVPYGGGTNYRDCLFKATQGLQVIAEGRDDSTSFEKARQLLQTAEALCFLGFGFDKTNLRRLGGQQINAAGVTELYAARGVPFAASALGLTDAEMSAAANAIAHPNWSESAKAKMFNGGCLATLRHSLILG